MAEINGKSKEGTIFKILWNFETLFFLAGANESSMSQQMGIFYSFSKLRIYNCIIVRKKHYNIDKKYSSGIKVNVADTGMKLGIYTCFPHQSSYGFTDVNDITLLESWVISPQGHFTKNTDLFPGKIGKIINGCLLKAFVYGAISYFTTNYIKHTYSNGSFMWYIERLEYELLRVVLQQMNMTFYNVLTPDEKEFRYTRVVSRSIFEMYSFIALGGVVKIIKRTQILTALFRTTL